MLRPCGDRSAGQLVRSRRQRAIDHAGQRTALPLVMTRGPLHPDGRSHWDGHEWLPIRSSPATLRAHFQLVLLVLVVIAALAWSGRYSSSSPGPQPASTVSALVTKTRCSTCVS